MREQEEVKRCRLKGNGSGTCQNVMSESGLHSTGHRQVLGLKG